FSLCLLFFNDPSPPHIYTLSLHDALPIYRLSDRSAHSRTVRERTPFIRNTHRLQYSGFRNRRAHYRRSRHRHPRKRRDERGDGQDRKSTRLNSSHLVISYAVFCLKKKTNK